MKDERHNPPNGKIAVARKEHQQKTNQILSVWIKCNSETPEKINGGALLKTKEETLLKKVGVEKENSSTPIKLKADTEECLTSGELTSTLWYVTFS